jgi:hypothetical protein
MIHETTIQTIVPTKQYVDEHTPDIIGYWSDNIYALPEDFGAVGDGVTDDTTSLADCISYAKTSGKPVRGYGKYKTTSTIVLDGEELDVYIREINYTGNSAAVSILNRFIVFEFHKIVSTGTGIEFYKYSSSRSAMRCQVKGNTIESSSHCINVRDTAYYCTIDVRKLASTSGDCIHRTNEGEGGGAEFVYRSSTCGCPNGYVANNISSSSFYDFTIESNCKYGLLNPVNCRCFGFRHREQIDLIRRRIENQYETDAGALIIFTVPPTNDGIYGFNYITSDPLLWYSIDVSAVSGYSEISQIDEWQHIAYNGMDLGVPIRNGRVVIGRLYFIGNNKVYVPEGRREQRITSSVVNFALMDSNVDADIIAAPASQLATDYIIDVSHADIYFGAMFGAIGYGDLSVKQENGNTCTIYDKLGNVLFDGTSEGDGTWALKCKIDFTAPNRYTGTTLLKLYDGTNEIWEVTKIE